MVTMSTERKTCDVAVSRRGTRTRRGASRARSPLVALALTAVATLSLLNVGGCGEGGSYRDLMEKLEARAGAIGTLRYTCLTEDGERLYREEFELAFPDRYRYRLYEDRGGSSRLVNAVEQRGEAFFRARATYAESGALEKVESETALDVPPLRNGGKYLGLYHMVGNADYFHSILSLLEGGSLELKGKEEVDGAPAYRLDSAAGLTPRLQIWLDAGTGMPLRKDLFLGEERKVVFRFQGYKEDFPYPELPFPPDAKSLFGNEGPAVSPLESDGGCRSLDLPDAAALVGFDPLIPTLGGFELTGARWRDPAAFAPASGGQSIQYPEGFRELYLLYRDGARQVEIRESPYDPDFAYYTMGLGTLTGAYLAQQEMFGEEAGGASYTAALDCQEMHLVAGDLEITVTGDLSRDAFADLAAQLVELASGRE
mgnify:FL=1